MELTSKKKSVTLRTDLYLHKSMKENILKKNKKRNNSKIIHIQNHNLNKIYKNKDELDSHFILRESFSKKIDKPKTIKEWNSMNSLSECYANQILLKVTYSESIQKQIQLILNKK